jgi:hypothetical protein
MYFDTGGVFFQDETVFLNQRKRPETKLRASCLQQTGDGQNATLSRSDLGAVTQPVSRFNGATGGRAMIEASADILALISLAIFTAHALDAYRTG